MDERDLSPDEFAALLETLSSRLAYCARHMRAGKLWRSDMTRAGFVALATEEANMGASGLPWPGETT